MYQNDMRVAYIPLHKAWQSWYLVCNIIVKMVCEYNIYYWDESSDYPAAICLWFCIYFFFILKQCISKCNTECYFVYKLYHDNEICLCRSFYLIKIIFLIAYTCVYLYTYACIENFLEFFHLSFKIW